MGMTLQQFHNAARWYFAEKGLQNLWNQYQQIINSEAGSGVSGGTTLLRGLDLTASAGIQKDSTATALTLSGIFATGGEHGSTGFDTPPADPGGNSSSGTATAVGPHPIRGPIGGAPSGVRVPVNGFRTAV